MSQKQKKNNWSDLLVNIVGHEPPPDSLGLRNSFIENCLADQDGFKVTQAEIHHTMQKGCLLYTSPSPRD